jgi:putative inorganic carbon (HCO3(-)) transporter
VARGSARLAAIALVCAGLAWFAREADALDARTAELVLIACALAVLYHLAVTVDPAWLISAGIVASMFAGHWDELSLNASVGPHRALLGAGILALLLRAPPARDRPQIHLGGTHFLLAAALAYILISAIVEGTLGDHASQVVVIDTYGLVPFVLFVVAPAAFATHDQRMILLGFLVAAGAYLSVTAVLEQLEAYDLVWPSYIGDPAVGSHFGRARGPFAEAAADGLALYICATAAAVAWFTWTRPLPRLGAGLVAVIAPIAILLTVTRGAWLAAIAAAAIAFATTPRLRRYLPAAAAIATVGVLAAFAVIPGAADEARNRQQDKSSVYERENTTAAGLRMIADRPFVGFGWWFGNDEMMPYYRMDPDIPLTGAQAGLHNVYLLYGVALGVLGLGLWALALAVAFGRALSYRAPPGLFAWQVGLKGILVAFLVVAVFGPANYAFPVAVIWTWAGIVSPPWAPAAFPEAAAAATAAGNGRRRLAPVPSRSGA